MRSMLKKASTRQRVVVTVTGSPDRSTRGGQDDARAMKLVRIFCDAEPVVAQGRLQRRTI